MGTRLRFATAALVGLLAASALGPGNSAGASSSTVDDPLGDPVNYDGTTTSNGELDIEKAQLRPAGADHFAVSVKTACCVAPIVDWGDPDYPLKRVRWHIDTNSDRVDDYVVVYTPREPYEYNSLVKEYDVFDASGRRTCTGQWTIFFDEPFPGNGMHTGMPLTCIGSPSSVHWYVDSYHMIGARVAYEDRAPDAGWAGPVAFSGTSGPPKVPADGRLCFDVAGSPGDAAVVNLTPVQPSADGHGLLVSSDVKDPPDASNVNYAPGVADPNVAIAPIGADGKVCYENSPLAAVHLVADHLGTIDADAYTPATTTGAPTRKVDTRVGLGGSRIRAGGRLCFNVAGSPGDAAVVNLTPVQPSAAGHGLLVSSDVEDAPTASNVNYAPGVADPNVAIAPIGADGRVCFENSPLAAVHLVADHLGTIDADAYTAATTTGVPARKVDTRTGLGGARVPANGRGCFTVTGARGDAAVVNLTPVQPSAGGHGLLVSSDVMDPPDASNVNYAPGAADPNVAIAPIGADGKVCYENSPLAAVHLVADHLGTIDADAYTPATTTGAPARKVDTRIELGT